MSEMDPVPTIERNNGSSNLHRSLSSLSKKESMRRKGGHGPYKIEQRIDISDLYDPPPVSNENDLPDDNNMIVHAHPHHILESANCDVQLLGRFVINELRDMGVMVDQPASSSSSSSRRSMSKGRKPTNLALPPNQVFELVEAKIDQMTVRLSVPHVIKLTCEFIRKEITTEGIFRKSGLTSRIRNLKKRLDENEAGIFEPEDTVYDASSVLKQYLRELPCPLIPYDVQPVFLKCLENSDEKAVVEAILLSVYLLPLPNIHILSYLMAFLHEVTKYSHSNRMGYKNLALVMTPNIMPVDLKKSSNQKGKDVIMNEKLAHESHRKVVEILILYGDYVGSVSKKLSKALNIHQSMYRNSEDELLDVEVSKDGRRKKRRSGSLTRMLGFLRKVTNGKGGGGCDTPGSVIDSSDEFGLLHTPVINGALGNKKRNNEEPLFASAKKKTILDAVRRHGLYGDDANSPGLSICPSPAVCLNPSPMRADWKNTPKLITPSLLRDKKRSRSARETERVPLSAPPGQVQNQCPPSLKSSSKKVGFGRKSGKKVALIHQQVAERLQKSGLTCSAVSIHHLSDSPRKMQLQLQQIGQDLEQEHPGKRDSNSNSTSKMNADAGEGDGDGVYVRISSVATTDDPKNDAFIASSNSLDLDLDDTPPQHHSDGQSSPTNNNNNKIGEEIAADIDQQMTRKNVHDSTFDNISPEMLRLTPLIKEINQLTMFAQREGCGIGDEDVSMSSVPILPSFSSKKPNNNNNNSSKLMRDNLESSYTNSPKEQLDNNINMNMNMNITPDRELDGQGPCSPSAESLAKVDQEFMRTMKEERIINLTSEMKSERRLSIGSNPNINVNTSFNSGKIQKSSGKSLQRCASIQDPIITRKGISPSQRRINSFRGSRHRSMRSPRDRDAVASAVAVATTTSSRIISHSYNHNSKSSSSIPSLPSAASSSSSSSIVVVPSPRFMSLRSPRSRPTPPPLVVRSPSRCTLRRGRPNTYNNAGLTKPSPCRNPNPGGISARMANANSTSTTSTSTSSSALSSSRSPRRCATVYAGTTTPRVKTKNNEGHGITPIMRRMSSVQELVKQLEGKNYRTNNNNGNPKLTKQHSSAVEFPTQGPHHQTHGYQLRRATNTLPMNNGKGKDRRSLPSNSGSWEVQDDIRVNVNSTNTKTKDDQSPKSSSDNNIIKRNSIKKERMKTPPNSSSSLQAPPIPPPSTKKKITTTPNQGDTWTNASDFDFESMSNHKMLGVCSSASKRTHTNRSQNPNSNQNQNQGDGHGPITAMSDRESIHVLKTRNAGKVSENVRIFNGMVKRNVKSPGGSTSNNNTKSMIPRYTALHASGSSKTQLPPIPPRQPQGQSQQQQQPQQ